MNKNKNLEKFKKDYKITDEQKQKYKEARKNMTDEQKQKNRDYEREYKKKHD